MVRKIVYFAEQLLRIDFGYLSKGGLWTSLSFLVSTLASLVTMVAFANLLPRETYGIYNYLLALGASLSFLTLSGAGPALMRTVAKGYKNLVRASLTLQLKYNAAASLVVLATAFYYGAKGNWTFAIALMLLILAYPIAEAFHIYKHVLTGEKRFDTLTHITSAISIVGALITVGTLLITDNILTLIGIYALMTLGPNIIIYKMLARKLPRQEPAKENLEEMRRTSLHLTGAGMIGVIASYVDKVVLFQVAGPAMLAVYGFAMAGPDRLKSLIKNWGSIALPRLAENSLAEINKVIYHRLGLSIVAGGALFLVYWFLSPTLFKIFLPRYMDAVFYSQILAGSLILVPISTYIGAIFSSQNMLRAMYLMNFGNHVVRIGLFVIFGFLWQIWGLVIASILSQAFNALYGLVVWKIESRRLMRGQS